MHDHCPKIYLYIEHLRLFLYRLCFLGGIIILIINISSHAITSTSMESFDKPFIYRRISKRCITLSLYFCVIVPAISRLAEFLQNVLKELLTEIRFDENNLMSIISRFEPLKDTAVPKPVNKFPF